LIPHPVPHSKDEERLHFSVRGFLSGLHKLSFGTPPAAAKEREAWRIPPNPHPGLCPWTPLPKTYPCKTLLANAILRRNEGEARAGKSPAQDTDRPAMGPLLLRGRSKARAGFSTSRWPGSSPSILLGQIGVKNGKEDAHDR